MKNEKSANDAVISILVLCIKKNKKIVVLFVSPSLYLSFVFGFFFVWVCFVLKTDFVVWIRSVQCNILVRFRLAKSLMNEFREANCREQSEL